jgi:hypothetical protein
MTSANIPIAFLCDRRTCRQNKKIKKNAGKTIGEFDGELTPKLRIFQERSSDLHVEFPIPQRAFVFVLRQPHRYRLALPPAAAAALASASFPFIFGLGFFGTLHRDEVHFCQDAQEGLPLCFLMQPNRKAGAGLDAVQTRMLHLRSFIYFIFFGK